MRLVFTPNGWSDYRHWQATDRATLKRVNRLLDDVLRDPFDGVSAPRPPGWISASVRPGCSTTLVRLLFGAPGNRT